VNSYGLVAAISIMPDNVITLDWRNAEHRTAAAQLVLTLFPNGPAGMLGRAFLTEFYFLDLIRDGEMECLLYASQGRYVGFAQYTDNPFGFIRNGVRRHFFKLSVLVGRSVMTNPGRLAAIFNVTKQGSYRATHGADTRIGELLTFGVLESYRQDVDPESGMRLAAHLFRVAMTRLRDRNLAVAQLVTDKDNLRAQAFFKKNGGVVDPAGYCDDKSILLKFDLHRMPL
jgi:ribosomal protein S18 acetylase RimI-like enzyme